MRDAVSRRNAVSRPVERRLWPSHCGLIHGRQKRDFAVSGQEMAPQKYDVDWRAV